jgi:hypothetical protein
MFPYTYALEKLSDAVRTLAICEGDVRSRLWLAFLGFQPLQAEHLPPTLQADFQLIMHELTRREPRDEYDQREWNIDGAVKANLKRMQNRTGSSIAKRIVDLQHQVQVAYEEWEEGMRRQS